MLLLRSHLFFNFSFDWRTASCPWDPGVDQSTEEITDVAETRQSPETDTDTKMTSKTLMTSHDHIPSHTQLILNKLKS